MSGRLSGRDCTKTVRSDLVTIPQTVGAENSGWSKVGLMTDPRTAADDQRTFAALLDELNHGYLFAQPGREKALGNHGVDAAHDVNHLSYPEACGDAAQSIGIELG